MVHLDIVGSLTSHGQKHLHMNASRARHWWIVSSHQKPRHLTANTTKTDHYRWWRGEGWK